MSQFQQNLISLNTDNSIPRKISFVEKQTSIIETRKPKTPNRNPYKSILKGSSSKYDQIISEVDDGDRDSKFPSVKFDGDNILADLEDEHLTEHLLEIRKRIKPGDLYIKNDSNEQFMAFYDKGRL
jgi:hypothetical protein